MRSVGNVRELIKRLRVRPDADVDRKIHDGISRALEEWKQTKPALTEHNIGRIIMISKMTKIAAVTAAIVIVGLVITFWEQATPQAYALGQTIEANHSVRYIHIRYTDAVQAEPKEFWIECDEAGRIKNARCHMPEWDSPEDGAKLGVWKENRVEVWFKKKNFLFIARDTTTAARILELVEGADPRLAVERLHKLEREGRVRIDINEPSDKGEPIVLTAGYLPTSSTPWKKEVLIIDRATKLVVAREIYGLEGGEYKYMGVEEYFDYNQPIDGEMFSLDDEVPANVGRLDQIAQEVGLPQGTLSDEEVAVEVARQFFKALIAEDYAKAGQLLEGMPPERLREGVGHMRFLRIVSVGPAGPHPIPETQGLVVPCTVEVEKDGQTSEWKLEQLGVRQVYGQPDRWTIFGGL